MQAELYLWSLSYQSGLNESAQIAGQVAASNKSNKSSGVNFTANSEM